MNLTGSIYLLKLEKVGIATIKNKKCVIIPIEENDLYVSMDENLKAKSVYLGLNVNERREPSQFGKTHIASSPYQSNTGTRTRRRQRPNQRFILETSSLMSLRVQAMRLLRWKRL